MPGRPPCPRNLYNLVESATSHLQPPNQTFEAVGNKAAGEATFAVTDKDEAKVRKVERSILLT